MTFLTFENATQTLTNKTISANNNTITDLANTDVGLGNVQNTKVNLTATTDPSATDDTIAGYSIGSRWINTLTNTEFVCLDATTTAAVWTVTTSVGSVTVFYNNSDTEITTTSIVFQQKVRLTFTAEAADYIVHWTYQYETVSGGTNIIVRVQEDDTITHSEQDARTSTSTSWIETSGFVKTTLTAGSHNFDIDFASSSAGKTVGIRRTRIYAYRVA